MLNYILVSFSKYRKIMFFKTFAKSFLKKFSLINELFLISNFIELSCLRVLKIWIWNIPVFPWFFHRLTQPLVGFKFIKMPFKFDFIVSKQCWYQNNERFTILELIWRHEKRNRIFYHFNCFLLSQLPLICIVNY